jgi:hypothetical protein
MYAAELQLYPDGWSGYGGALTSDVHVGSAGRQRVAVVVAFVDGSDRTPEIPERLVVPAVDQRVRCGEVQHCEEADFFRDCQPFGFCDRPECSLNNSTGLTV